MTDEEIMIERVKEWNDSQSHSGPAPVQRPASAPFGGRQPFYKPSIAPPVLMRPHGQQPSDAAPPPGPKPVEQEGSGWRSRKPLC